ncbi:hypothetical protein QCA50_011218 [Cerrena zonata]|uniref:DUF6535 domain-containing protein n=1 Tax=Cerrena zonata TaxID=2478898 RepID=A0AAW0FYI6_9APHY
MSSSSSMRRRRSRTSTRMGISDLGDGPASHSDSQKCSGIEGKTVASDDISIKDLRYRMDVKSPPDTKEIPPNIEEKVQRVKIESDRTGWGRLSDLIRQYDRARVEDVKEDIDTLLVFAGLFSSVITAFIIESYKALQQQPEDTTNQILLHLSVQIASLTVSGNFVNSTIPSFTTPSFIPIKHSVLINTLWLLSLVFALITASLGILVKQWLHELMARDTQDPRQQVKIRFFREVGVQKWQVFEIAAALPLLLQLALFLFFIGLSAFLHDLNPVVTWVVTGVMILWLLFYLFTTLAPAFSSQCPYKTPMLKGLLHQVRVRFYTWPKIFTRMLHVRIPSRWKTMKERVEALTDSLHDWSTTWTNFEEANVRNNNMWDLPTLACSREILRGEQLDETLTDCFRKCYVWVSIRCIKLLSQGEGPVVQGVLPDISHGLTRQTCELFVSLIGDPVLTIRGPWPLPYLYVTLPYALSAVYNPDKNYPIPSASLPMFIRLILKDHVSAVFSILTMHSVRHRIMEGHPDYFSSLFPDISNDVMQVYSIGAEFVSNLVAATTAICHGLWNQSNVDSDVQWILYCINPNVADGAIPIDPLVITYTFAKVLSSLIPPPIVQEHRDILVGAMGDLANFVADPDGSAWQHSRKRCVEFTHEYFRKLGLVDKQLIPKLRDLIRTWRSDFDPERSIWDQ